MQELSSQAGGRGVTFRDKTHQNCLTDMFLGRNPDLSEEYLIQIANRLSGKFEPPMVRDRVPTRLQFWASKELTHWTRQIVEHLLHCAK